MHLEGQPAGLSRDPRVTAFGGDGTRTRTQTGDTKITPVDPGGTKVGTTVGRGTECTDMDKDTHRLKREIVVAWRATVTMGQDQGLGQKVEIMVRIELTWEVEVEVIMCRSSSNSTTHITINNHSNSNSYKDINSTSSNNNNNSSSCLT